MSDGGRATPPWAQPLWSIPPYGIRAEDVMPLKVRFLRKGRHSPESEGPERGGIDCLCRNRGQRDTGTPLKRVRSNASGGSFSSGEIGLCSQPGKLGWNLFRGARPMDARRGNLTPQDLLLPEGKLIRTTRGGSNALKQLLLDLKKYSFSGYVRTVRSAGGRRSEGIVLLRAGNPEASLHQRDDSQDRGRNALKKVWQDSYDESCVLELHARVDMDGLVREYADAVLERPAAILREKLRDPIRHPDVDAEVEILREALENRQRMESQNRLERSRERDFKERTKKVLELVLKQRQEDRSPGSLPTPEEVDKAIDEASPPNELPTNLAAGFTFEGFTVGESNRFAHTASVSVAKQPAKAYNPLLITSGPGLGKTHLLHAIGNYIMAHEKGAKVLYLTCEAFASGLAEGRANGGLAGWRERVRGVDCLLLDDIQFLGGMPEVHEELFHAFNELHTAEKQIVLASDRPPKVIPNLDERLVSRFEAGLVAGMEPPDLATRVAILERRAKDASATIDPDVLKVIATLAPNNVRELGGALNRVVAFSAMMRRPITEELAREVLSESVAVPAQASVVEPKPSEAPSFQGLHPGRSYLIEEDRPSEAYRRLAAFLAGRGGGLIITRTNPKRIRETYDLASEKILWLTDRQGSPEETIAPALERIVYELEDFMTKQASGAILIDGVEYLVSNNSFDAVLKFVRRLLYAVSESRYALIISIGPATVKEQELRVLEREMEVIRIP